ncbi:MULTISPECIES: type II toxin-antitoxin system PemK/MazF family toxin [unclassified Clostridium]|uniref:type II toxin-antitoxin system PemK/MazF family toxin n=1 Tax=unclassified Clostridium TaxID=2614128 RepID=UPI0011057BB2|nr:MULTISPECIES: type II toxin-antitoxin system PemK/MazF family toxin [unclassified Clostridium]MBY1896629.1 type II toxin-antitoxin system PemK/MazF family toxin [Clostridioides difficile]
MKNNIKRGDIYFARLNPIVGSEQGGKHRPVLIISNNKGNRYSTTVIVAAITGMEHNKANLPTHVIAKGCEFLEKDSIILLEQIRTLDKQRLQEYIGTFDKHLMLSVDDALAVSIGVKIAKPESEKEVSND